MLTADAVLRPVVLDASVAIAYLRDEDASTEVRRRLRAWARSGTELLMPSLLWIEVLNVLHRRYGWDAASVVEGILNLDGLEARSVEVDRPLLLLAAGQMEAFGLSAYDAVYLSLTLAVDGCLATLDGRLARAAEDRAIPFTRPQRSVGEAPAPYATRDRQLAWARSAVVGGHIAELRRRALDEVTLAP